MVGKIFNVFQDYFKYSKYFYISNRMLKPYLKSHSSAKIGNNFHFLVSVNKNFQREGK